MFNGKLEGKNSEQLCVSFNMTLRKENRKRIERERPDNKRKGEKTHHLGII